MKRALILLPVMALLSGCVSFMSTPPDLAHIVREHANSAKVKVRDFELVRYEGQILLAGKVGRQFFDADTSKTHLDVMLYAADGSVLRALTAEFNPRQVYRGYRMPGSSSYHVVLDPLPPGLARVEVLAHDGEHSTTSRSLETQTK
jgi:hypothetical protein